MSKHLSSTDIIKEQQEQNVKNFTSDYYELCAKYKLQIVQSPLSIVDYQPIKEEKNENKVAS